MSSPASTEGSALVQRTLLWILERVSYDWRIRVAAWVGWPGAETFGMAGSHNQQSVGEDALVTPAQRAADQRTTHQSNVRRLQPWAGARVEWTLDTRGEEDVGYRLLPQKLPSFISVAKARSVLEAGRALRLLRKAAEPDHPLVQLLSEEQQRPSSSSSSYPPKGTLPLPSWLTSEPEFTSYRLQAQTRIRQLQQSIAAWRSGRPVPAPQPPFNTTTTTTTTVQKDSDPPTISHIGGNHHPDGEDDDDNFPSVPPLAGPPTTTSNLPRSGRGPDDPLTLMEQCNAVPDLDGLHDEELVDEEGDPDYRDFVQWINQPSSPTSQVATTSNNQSASGHTTLLLGGKPAQRLLELPLMWSNLISRALISVFFRDLGLPAYLSTCRDFLLLGSAQFAEQLHNLLFSDGLDDPPMSLLGRNARTRGSTVRPPGEGLSWYLAPTPTTAAVGPTGAPTKRSWPPTAGQIAPRFNAAVLEAIAERRAQAVVRAERAERAERVHTEKNEQRFADNKSAGRSTSYDPMPMTTSIRGGATTRRDHARDALMDLDERLSFALVDPHVSKIRGRKRSRWQDPTCTYHDFFLFSLACPTVFRLARDMENGPFANTMMGPFFRFGTQRLMHWIGSH